MIAEIAKPESAKTITLSSNENIISNLQRQSQTQTTKAQPSPNDSSEERKLEDAVIKIQALFRRRQIRKNMKQPARNEEPEQTQEELENEFRSDDVGEYTNVKQTLNYYFCSQTFKHFTIFYAA